MKNLTEIEKKIKWQKYYDLNDENVWMDISKSKTLSEDFIREFSDKVNWENISISQKLSEKFIREFINKINFNFLSDNIKIKKFSEQFIIDFADKLNLTHLILHKKNIPDSVIEKYHDKIHWSKLLFVSFSLSDGFRIKWDKYFKDCITSKVC